MNREHVPPDFDCSMNQTDDCTFVRPTGSLDAFAAAEFRKTLACIHDAKAVVVDLSQVRFIDSAGLGVLVALIRRVRDRGHVAAVAVPGRQVRRLLNEVGFGRIAVVADSVEDAARMVTRP
jgi:anti-sigma B factor antagonist